jgi:hypothetical protein
MSIVSSARLYSLLCDATSKVQSSCIPTFIYSHIFVQQAFFPHFHLCCAHILVQLGFIPTFVMFIVNSAGFIPTFPALLCPHFGSARHYSLLCDVHTRFSWLYSHLSTSVMLHSFGSARLYSLLCNALTS